MILKRFNEYSSDIDIERWMSGECIPFCVALCDVFPDYSIGVLNNEYDDVDEDAEYNYDFVHAFCYVDGNYKIIVDARGVRSLNDLYDEFHDINPIIDWDIKSTKQLIDEYSGKTFASEESFEYDVEEYELAKEFILSNKSNFTIKK